eukprot:scaffold7730_cov110-Isochrysis_galbana.AAC.10
MREVTEREARTWAGAVASPNSKPSGNEAIGEPGSDNWNDSGTSNTSPVAVPSRAARTAWNCSNQRQTEAEAVGMLRASKNAYVPRMWTCRRRAHYYLLEM